MAMALVKFSSYCLLFSSYYLLSQAIFQIKYDVKTILFICQALAFVSEGTVLLLDILWCNMRLVQCAFLKYPL